MGSVLLDLWMRDTGEIAKRISEKEARGEDVTEDRAELLRLLNQMDRYDQMRRERREKGSGHVGAIAGGAQGDRAGAMARRLPLRA